MCFINCIPITFSASCIAVLCNVFVVSLFLLEAWCVVLYLLIYYGIIIEVPHLYKSAAPINYILPTLTYLYVRAVLYNETKFRWKDMFHFLPFIFFVINYMPFYLLPIGMKSEIVVATVKNINLTYKYDVGLIPEYISYLFRFVQTIFYLMLQWKLIIQFKKYNQNTEIQKQIVSVIRWLKVFTWSSTLFVIGFFILIFLAARFQTIYTNNLVGATPGFLISLSFFVISSYLLTHQNILVGLPFVKYQETVSSHLTNKIEKVPFILEDYSKEIDAIEKYFETKSPYLKKNITLSEVAVALKLPTRDLSYFLNNHYNQRFTDFINSYRIRYILNKYNESYLDKFTIEAVAMEAGFSSKSAFYKSFHKLYHTTPSDYFDNQHNKF